MAPIPETLAAGLEHHWAGQFDAAEQIYRRILQTDPNSADAWHLLGLVAHQLGRHETAVQHIQQAIQLSGHHPVLHNNLGAAYAALGRTGDAIACYQRALELRPDYAEACNNLGNALKQQGSFEEAVASFRRALQLKPDYAEALYNLGTVMREQGRLAEAAECYRKTLQLRPDLAEAHNNLGNALKHLGKLAEAIACYQQAVQRKPDYAEAHANLSAAFKQQGQLTEAGAAAERAIQLKPDFAEAYKNLGDAFKQQGRIDDALASYQRALQPKPDFAEAQSNLLLALHYRAGVTLAELAEAHADFERRFAASLRAAWKLHSNTRDPERRLRLGFVSPDFGRHPVGYFLIRCLECLDHEQAEAICYNDRAPRDNLTARLQAAASTWHEVFGWSDDRLAELIRADRIDILFDLAGHTANHRLLLFARKPSPIQITWAGYVGTTGLAAMDYVLADRWQIPTQAEPHYRERVLRMPDGYVCYDPPGDAPAVSSAPALEKGFVTFGCFNQPAKLGPQVVAVWSGILRRLPQVRLLLKYKGMDDASVAGRLRSLFARHGVDPNRVEFLGRSSHAALLEHYRQVDLALDPFPFGGGLTTCEALWMGVPVVTCPGETFASRHALSHLTNVGLTETIAGSFDAYVDIAVSLAGDLPRLAKLRGELRDRVAASPLCDGRRFAGNFAQLLRGVWRGRVARP